MVWLCWLCVLGVCLLGGDIIAFEPLQADREETLEQLREFQAFLDKTVSGNMTLVDEFGAAQLVSRIAVVRFVWVPLYHARNNLHLWGVFRRSKLPSAKRLRRPKLFVCLQTRIPASCGRVWSTSNAISNSSTSHRRCTIGRRRKCSRR